ncbi:MAG TPA: hypothetical protein EYP73_07145 [Acidimicrobiia bacterium]|nr:hypothetical protein [Acidimicrobiia bacterium]
MRPLDLADGLRLLHSSRGEGRFGHREHLRFGWALLAEAADVEEAERVAALTIRHAAEVAGSPTKYHYTMTLFWIRMLARVREDHEVSTLDEAIQVHPDLADPHLPDRYWSNIGDEEARRRWVEPALQPLP